MAKLDRERSEATALAAGARVKECYRNALMALLIIDELATCTYVEGVAVPDETHVPIEHGWLETPDGAVIDPTLVLFLQGDVAYYDGERYDFHQASGLVGRKLPAWRKGSLAFRRAWFGGMMHGVDPNDHAGAAMIAQCRKLYRLDEGDLPELVIEGAEGRVE